MQSPVKNYQEVSNELHSLNISGISKHPNRPLIMPVIDFLIRLNKQTNISDFLRSHVQIHIEYFLEPFKSKLTSDKIQLEHDL